MSDDFSHVAPGRDETRQVATTPDQFTLTIEEAATRYEHAGHPRTIRSIQRYCAKGHLDCLRQETTFGDKFMISPESVARHIAQIAELASATRRDEPRQVAASIDQPRQENVADNLVRHEVMTHDDTSRHDATSHDRTPPVAPGPTEVTSPSLPDLRYVEQLEIRIAEKDEVITLLTSELDTKNSQIVARDHQIVAMLERDREVNFLMQGFQKLMGLLPKAQTETTPTGESRGDQQPSS